VSQLAEAPCYKPGGREFDSLVTGFFSTDLILPAARGPEFYSASNRNEYQNQKNNVSGRARPMRKADNLTAICELLDVSQERTRLHGVNPDI
jgi:hypothetical protein